MRRWTRAPSAQSLCSMIYVQVDASTKRSEFVLWALEVKKKDPELLMKNEERELFRDFMEDYNTGKWVGVLCAAPCCFLLPRCGSRQHALSVPTSRSCVGGRACGRMWAPCVRATSPCASGLACGLLNCPPARMCCTCLAEATHAAHRKHCDPHALSLSCRHDAAPQVLQPGDLRAREGGQAGNQDDGQCEEGDGGWGSLFGEGRGAHRVCA